jgi:hypothetical protein
MRTYLADAIFLAGLGQLGVLIASALVPLRLKWKHDLGALPRLHRQLFWVYGGYVVLGIISLGVISIANAEELAGGGLLARCVCGYAALFWGVRLPLQAVLDAKPFLTAWWLRLGYHTLTPLFAAFTLVFGAAALLP